MKTLTMTLAATLLACIASAPALANDKYRANVDVSEATGDGVDGLVAALCEVPVMRLLDSAVIRDTAYAANGDDLIQKVVSNDITEDEMNAISAKLVEVEFRAGSIIDFSNSKLRDKIEEYIADTYIALFGHGMPLRRVRIAALYPINDGTIAVVYGTVIWNDHGLYGPGNLPSTWDTWRLHRELRE